MKQKIETIETYKIGKTTFNKSVIAAMSFEEFEKMYSSMRGVNLSEIYKACGGVIKVRKKDKGDVGFVD